MDARGNTLTGRRGFIGTLAGLSFGILLGGPEPAQATKKKIKGLLQLDVNKDVIYRDEGDGAFLFKPETGNLRYINPLGKEVFLTLKRKEDLGQMINHLHGFYPEVDPERLRKDVSSFLKELEENGYTSPLEA